MAKKDAPPRWDRRMQQRLARGEAAALGELYDRFASLVHSLAHRVLDDERGRRPASPARSSPTSGRTPTRTTPSRARCAPGWPRSPTARPCSGCAPTETAALAAGRPRARTGGAGAARCAAPRSPPAPTTSSPPCPPRCGPPWSWRTSSAATTARPPPTSASPRTRPAAGCGSASNCSPRPTTPARSRASPPGYGRCAVSGADAASGRRRRRQGASGTGRGTGQRRPRRTAGPRGDPRPRAAARHGTRRPGATGAATRTPPAHAAGAARRSPLPEPSGEDTGSRARCPQRPRRRLVLEHRVLKSLLGAWALAACSAEETAAVEDAPHRLRALRGRGPAAARRGRPAAHRPESLDLDPLLRSRVLEGCLGRRPARIPVPDWATPYDAETARLDALLRDIGDAEWHAPGAAASGSRTSEPVSRRTTVAGVIGHLMAVDGLVAAALGLDDPLGRRTRRRRRPTDAHRGVLAAPRTARPPAPSASLARAEPHPGPHGVLRGARRRPNCPSRTGTSPCRCGTRCWTGPSSAGCTPGTSRRRWTTRTSRPPPPICTGMIDLAARLLPARPRRTPPGRARRPRPAHLVAAGAPGRIAAPGGRGLGRRRLVHRRWTPRRAVGSAGPRRWPRSPWTASSSAGWWRATSPRRRRRRARTATGRRSGTCCSRRPSPEPAVSRAAGTRPAGRRTGGWTRPRRRRPSGGRSAGSGAPRATSPRAPAPGTPRRGRSPPAAPA